VRNDETRPPMDSAQRRFNDITNDRFRAMVARVGEKRDRRQRVIQVGQRLPFTLNEYRERILVWLGYPGGHARCTYCGTPIDISTMRMDHMRPLAQGGSIGLENLAPSCERCNDQKGGMTAKGYSDLRTWALENLTPADQDNLFIRLQIAVKLATKDRQNIARLHRAQATTP
jgi:5-methylcytosine-specific restriction endonuclease McrA